jgi:hypothetical protein
MMKGRADVKAIQLGSSGFVRSEEGFPIEIRFSTASH